MRMFSAMNWLLLGINQMIDSTTNTTIPDDFLNLYPEDVPDNVGDLAGTGFAPGPLIVGAALLVVIGLASLASRHRKRI